MLNYLTTLSPERGLNRCDVTMLALNTLLTFYAILATYSLFIFQHLHIFEIRGVYVYKFGNILSMRVSNSDTKHKHKHTHTPHTMKKCQVIFHLFPCW